jgi:hypothetical protein
MKVVALFQIYLPYFLPRTPQWSEGENFQFQFEVEGHLVNVHPRRADERLFPSPLDEQLSQAKINLEEHFAESDLIVPVDAPIEISVRDRCFDRVEVQVYGEVASRDECAEGDVTWQYRRCAISACNKFLYLCRTVARDPDITGLTWYYDFGNDRCYFGPPHSLIWFDADSKEVLRDDEGQEFWRALSGSVRSPVRLPVDFDMITQSFSRAEQDLPAELLVSARERLIAEQLQEGVINLASACEIAAARYVERKSMSGDAQVKAIIEARRLHSFAERHFHLVPSHIDGRSLKTDDPDAFDLLEKAYRTRNRLAHTGELAYQDAASRTTVVVTRSMTIEFFRGCERAVDWINKL